jgi:hypothetical protein
MYITTHDVEKIITFDSIRENFKYFEKYNEFNHQNESTIFRVVCMLCITTGLDMKLVSKLKWKDLLILGSENNAIVKDILKIRQYHIPIHPKVKQFLSDSYCGFGFPNLESSFSDSFTVEEYQGETAELIVRCMSSSSKLWVMKKEYLREFNFESYPQIMFGRKVFEVNGYTNDISKYLKLHFGFRTNKELFQFLGYDSKDDIKCELHSINLFADGNFIMLEDKNFNKKSENNNYYPFQKFSAFSNFLTSGVFLHKKYIFNSIRILLLVSLYNGIKLTKLLKLKWSDIGKVNVEKKCIEIRPKSVFGEYYINIDEKFKKIIEALFIFILKEIIEETHNWASKNNCDMVQYSNENIEKYYLNGGLINEYVFITKTGNPITQPSLSREIKKTLNYLKFPHADKMTSNSTLIMYGRRIIEIKGDHKPTIKKLKEHFKFKSKKELFNFLYLINSKEKSSTNFKGKMRKNIFEDILYDY